MRAPAFGNNAQWEIVVTQRTRSTNRWCSINRASGDCQGADHFYNVEFHELTHWTGHKSRLDRDLKNRFVSRDYAAEELVAELARRRVPLCGVRL